MSWFSRIEIVPVEKGQIVLSHLLSLRTSHWVLWWWGVGAPWGLSFFWGNLLSGEFLTKPCLEDLFLSVHVCMHILHICMYMWICVYCMHMCVETEGWCRVSSSVPLPLISWDRMSHWTRSSQNQLHQLGSKARETSCLHLPRTGSVGMYTARGFLQRIFNRTYF